MQQETMNIASKDWRSIRLTETGQGYRVREDGRRFRGEVRRELAFRFVGLSALVAGAAIWLIAPQTMVGLWPTMTLSVLFALTGMVLFTLSARGFRRELHADLKNRELRLAKLNAKNRALVIQRLPLAQIESLYVRRVSNGADTLILRLPGGRRLPLMRGREEELTALHRMLCRDIAVAEQVSPAPAVRPVHPVIRRHRSARTARPVMGMMA